MPTKNGMGGHAKEAYDPATGKFIEDGKANVRHPNPNEAQKIAGGVSPQKIQKESANTMSAPTPNLGKYAEPHKKVETEASAKEERNKTLRELYGIEVDPETEKFSDDLGQAVDVSSGIVDQVAPTNTENIYLYLEETLGNEGADLHALDYLARYISKNHEVPEHLKNELGIKNYDDLIDAVEENMRKNHKKVMRLEEFEAYDDYFQ